MRFPDRGLDRWEAGRSLRRACGHAPRIATAGTGILAVDGSFTLYLLRMVASDLRAAWDRAGTDCQAPDCLGALSGSAQQMAQASSLSSVIRFVSTSLGIAVLATLVQARANAHFTQLAGQATSILAAQHLLPQSYVLALQDAFWFTLVVLLASIVAVCFIRTRKPTLPAAAPTEQQGEAQ